MYEAWASVLSNYIKLGTGCILEVEAGGSGRQGHPQLNREFDASLGCMKPWLIVEPFLVLAASWAHSPVMEKLYVNGSSGLGCKASVLTTAVVPLSARQGS